ncbi:MAG: hypothetical protein JKX75_08770 [Gammaproteobacteria bacterium]|nr:hypothetical protein [Gammaproteobacteria bacterium]
MTNITRILFLSLISLLAAACASGSEKIDKHQLGEQSVILCEEPRPEVCTREYNPVCALLKDGRTQTSSTACTACANREVIGYKMGECSSSVNTEK